MKAHQEHSNATDTGVKTKKGWNKLQVLKPCTHINKSSGNVAAKCVKGTGFLPIQSQTETETAYKTGILTESPPRGSKKLSAQPPSHSGKIKLQLFPIDENIQKILQQEKYNPYLELILAPRKKISSVVQHLNTKWGSAQCSKGELMLFPYDARLDSVAASEKWTINDSCTAADVHVAVGSPLTFRLRYGWFGPNLEQQISESTLASAHVGGSIIVNNPSDLVFSEQKQMVASSGFPSNFVKPSNVDNTNTIKAVDNQSKVAPLSWLNSISNISFGALLSEAAPSQDSKQLSSQFNSGLQQIPVPCLHNLTLASAHVGGSIIVNNPSDLGFSEQKQMVASSGFPSNFVKPSTVDNTNTMKAVDNQSKVAPLSWLDTISNISFGALLSEAAPSQDSKQLSSQFNSGLQQIPVTCDSFDAAIASLIACQQGSNQPRSSNPSLWEAEETCHAFSFQNQTSKRASNSAPGNSSGIATAYVLGAIPEAAADDDQQCSIKGREEELNTQAPVSKNDHDAKPEVSTLESTGDPEIGSSCSRLLSGADSLGLTDLLANSMDAFQNFSIF